MDTLHGTTILSVRRDRKVALGGDGQVTLGQVVLKGGAKKVRRLYQDRILAGFAGGTADAFTLFERFEAKLDKHQGNLMRAAVELAKDWRTDRVLRRLEAMLAVADKERSLIITGAGDVLEPEYGILAIGSGGPYAQAAARAGVIGVLFERLDRDAAERRVLAVFQDPPPAELVDPAELVGLVPRPWSEALARAYLDRLEAQMGARKPAADYLGAAWRPAALALPPGVFARALDLRRAAEAPADGYSPWKKVIEQFTDLVDLRRRIHEEIPT